MNTKIETIKVPHPNTNEVLLSLQITSLLVYSKEWVVEKNDMENVISVRRVNSANYINIDFQKMTHLKAV